MVDAGLRGRATDRRQGLRQDSSPARLALRKVRPLVRCGPCAAFGAQSQPRGQDRCNGETRRILRSRRERRRRARSAAAERTSNRAVPFRATRPVHRMGMGECSALRLSFARRTRRWRVARSGTRNPLRPCGARPFRRLRPLRLGRCSSAIRRADRAAAEKIEVHDRFVAWPFDQAYHTATQERPYEASVVYLVHVGGQRDGDSATIYDRSCLTSLPIGENGRQ